MMWNVVCTIDGLKRTTGVRSDVAHGFDNPKLYKKTNPARCTGFTLLEMMVAISIAAILLATAVPSLRQFRANNQVTTASNSIVTALNVARFNAVIRGENVVICPYDPRATPITCKDENWHRGWIVFRQNGASINPDGEFIPTDDAIIRTGILPGAFKDVSPLKPELQNKTHIVFEANGTTESGPIQPIDVCYSDTGLSKRYRQIEIHTSGFISSSKMNTLCS